jgi:hypothetical protein
MQNVELIALDKSSTAQGKNPSLAAACASATPLETNYNPNQI